MAAVDVKFAAERGVSEIRGGGGDKAEGRGGLRAAEGGGGYFDEDVEGVVNCGVMSAFSTFKSVLGGMMGIYANENERVLIRQPKCGDGVSERA